MLSGDEDEGDLLFLKVVWKGGEKEGDNMGSVDEDEEEREEKEKDDDEDGLLLLELLNENRLLLELLLEEDEDDDDDDDELLLEEDGILKKESWWRGESVRLGLGLGLLCSEGWGLLCDVSTGGGKRHAISNNIFILRDLFSASSIVQSMPNPGPPSINSNRCRISSILSLLLCSFIILSRSFLAKTAAFSFIVYVLISFIIFPYIKDCSEPSTGNGFL